VFADFTFYAQAFDRDFSNAIVTWIAL